MKEIKAKKTGAQRLGLERLKAWEALGYGMFIHFGMSTFDGNELSLGNRPSRLYAPDKLDVDQWVCVARDAGMKYAVLTAKHTAGHCLWPSKFNDYHVGTSGNKTDVVEAFVKACSKRGVIPGLYYGSWDNHNLFGSRTPAQAPDRAFVTQEYLDFQFKQVEEILTQYGKIGEVWIDTPHVLGIDGRCKQYEQIGRLQPEAVIVMNNAFTHGDTSRIREVWPTDIFTVERGLPSSRVERFAKHNPWIKYGLSDDEAKEHYVPAEVCDTAGWGWFCVKDDSPRPDADLLGMYLVSRARGANFLLDVGPNKNGLIPKPFVDALMRLRKNIERFG